MEKQGLIEIYTGNGKGKSTAAFGLALRASGWGMRSAVVQFMKPGEGYGEIAALAKIPEITVYSFGAEGFLSLGETPPPEHLAAAAAAMAKAEQVLADPRIDLVILDEINNAVLFGLVGEDEVLALLEHKQPGQELVLTGRAATPALIELADLVTEMREIKHPYQQGVNARRGIEY